MDRVLQRNLWWVAVAAVSVFLHAILGYAQPTPLDSVEFQVNAYTPCAQWHPQVAATPGAGFVVVWESCGSSGNDSDFGSVQFRRLDAEGRARDPVEIQANSYTTHDQVEPAVAADSEGNFVVVWQSWGSFGNDQDGYSIQARRFAADGTPLDAAEFQVNTYTTSYQQRPAVGMAPNGDFVVVWDSWGSNGDTSAYSVLARRYRASGAPLDAAEFVVNSYTTSSQFYPDVGVDARGNFVVSFFSDQGFTARARRFAADGTPLDPADLRVDTGGIYYPWRPAIAVTPGGGFVVAWQESRYSIHARRFAADGLPLDPLELQANADTSGYRCCASVAADPEGNFVVGWSDYGLPPPDVYADVQLRRFRFGASTPDPGEFQANEWDVDDQWTGDLAASTGGDFIAVWQSFMGSFGNDLDDWSIQARRFGTPTIPVTSTTGGTGGPGCTLRDAIAAANTNLPAGGCPPGNEGAVVELPAGSTVALTEPDNSANALPVIERPVTIRGHGSRIERDPGLACPVGPEFRLFEVADGGVLTLDDVSVSNGCLSSAAGAGVLASGGSVVLRKASIEGNEAGSDGGGVAVVGGNLLAFDSTVRGNLSAGSGGGVAVSGEPGWLLLDRTTISENASFSGGGLSLSSAMPALVRNSTFSGNEAITGGGGLLLSGPSPALTLDFSTVAGNGSPAGAGVMADSGVLALNGSLLGESAGGADCASGAGSVVASGANLDTDGSCAALAGANVSTVASLGLGPLADNGGWVRTHLPLAGSPALDAAPACATASGAALFLDARGYPRPTDDDGDLSPECDLGAVERGPIFLDGFESGDAARWSFAGP